MPKVDQYKIPSDWQVREALREKGQFWTPDWIAEAMVEYVLADYAAETTDAFTVT